MKAKSQSSSSHSKTVVCAPQSPSQRKCSVPSSFKQSIRIARRNAHITPRLNKWLLNNPTGVQIHDPAVQERISEVMSPKAHHGRDGAFHPSQLYQCQRAQVFGFYGVEVPREYNPVLLNLFNDGHFRHLRWQIMLLSAGVITDIEVPVQIPELRLVGSMDGVNADEGWMFELKGTSQYRKVQQGGAFDAHIKQVHAYLLAAGLDRAIIVYEDKASQDWIEIEIQKDDRIISEITSILQSLNEAIDNHTLPEVKRDCKNQTGREYGSCPYAGICLEYRAEDIAPVQSGRGTSVAVSTAPGTRRVRVRPSRA